ncbi:MAG: hypothetical protein AB7O52_05520 [Planctomycetota bacterium]
MQSLSLRRTYRTVVIDALGRRLHRWGGGLLLGFVVLAVVTSCSGDKGGSSTTSASGPTIEEIREEVLAFKQEAEDAGALKYAAPDFAKADKYLTDADGLIELLESEPAKASLAKNKLSQARSNFKTARNNAEANRKQFDKAEKVQKEYDALLAEQDAAKNPFRELDPMGWKAASDKYTEGLDLLKEGDPLKAGKRLAAALSDLKSSISRAELGMNQKSRAESARARMTETKQRALDAKAKELSPSDISYAEEQERQAVRYWDEGDFQLAESYFANAENNFAAALALAQGRAAATTTAGNPDGDPTDGGSRDLGRETFEPAPEVGKVTPPTADEGLDLDVQTALREGFHGSPDFKDGVLTLEYGLGQGPDMAKDFTLLGGKMGTNINLSGPTGVGLSDYLIGGNTVGGFLLKPVFEDKVLIDIEFQSQDNKGDISTTCIIMLMSDSSGSNFYGSEFGTNILVVSDTKGTNKVPSFRKDYLQHVSKWLQKRDPVRMQVKYVKNSDNEQGVITVNFNGEEVCRKETDFYTKGQVGMKWVGTKFFLREFKVKGQVNEEWAREFAGVQSKKQGEKKDEDFDF